MKPKVLFGVFVIALGLLLFFYKSNHSTLTAISEAPPQDISRPPEPEQSLPLTQAPLPVTDGQFKSELFQKIFSLHRAFKNKTPEVINKKTSLKKTSAAAAMIDQKPDQAALLLIEALDFDPTNLNAIELLAKINFSAGKSKAARNYAIECLAIDLESEPCQTVLLNSLTDLKEDPSVYVNDCLLNDSTNRPCKEWLLKNKP